MAFPTRWRKRFTAIFILTASLALAPPAPAQSCDTSPDSVEHAMQDGLSDLSRAEALYQEARAGGDGDPSGDGRLCGFLRGSLEYHDRARDRFRACVALVDETLARCPDASWDGISANPALCETRLAEIDARLTAISAEIVSLCDGD